MNDFRADLHCHSTCSDGSCSPEELVRLAKQIGLSALSITDHDTIDAYSKATPLCAELGIILLPGIEFSTMLKGVSVHILAYGFDVNNEELASFCALHVNRRRTRNQAILELLTANGMPLSEEDLISTIPIGEVAKKRVIGRPHIAQAMINKGYVTSIQDAFRKFIAEGQPYYVQGPSFSTEETIDLIHRIKGLAVIAHPHLIRKPAIVDTLLNLKFDGIECYYGRFQPKEHQRWLKIAEKKGWLVTGGSDFHGTVKPDLPLGSSWINQEKFSKVIEVC